MSLTIGSTTSLKIWVALKWALTHSAHVMLYVGQERQENEHNVNERDNKETGNGGRSVKLGRWSAINTAVEIKLGKV